MSNINNSKTDKNENSVLLKKSSLSNHKKNENNLFSSVPVGSHVRAHPRPEGVGVRAKPLGLVVKQQSSYSKNINDLCSTEIEKTAPYGYRRRWKTRLISKDGKITEVDSFASRQHRLTTAIHSFVDYVKPISKVENWDSKMVTLTYEKASDWSPNHIRDFNKWLRRAMGDNLKSYAFVAELQKRGAVHYHLIVYTKKGASIPFPDRAWGRKNYIAWKWGYTKVEKARLPQYLASYVSKEYQKDYYRFPKNARGFGIWVNSLLELKRLFSAYMSDKQKPLWILQDFPNLDFLKEENQLKRIGGKWRIGSEILTSKNAPKNFSFDGSKIRVFIPLGRRLNYKKTDTFDYNSMRMKTLKEIIPSYLEDLDIWYEKGGWTIHNELLESSVSFLDCEKIDGSTWVEELMSKKKPKPQKEEGFDISDYEITSNISKIRQNQIECRWRSHKEGKEVKIPVPMSWFRGLT
jgi:hypothetical protein